MLPEPAHHVLWQHLNAAQFLQWHQYKQSRDPHGGFIYKTKHTVLAKLVLPMHLNGQSIYKLSPLLSGFELKVLTINVQKSFPPVPWLVTTFLGHPLQPKGSVGTAQ